MGSPGELGIAVTVGLQRGGRLAESGDRVEPLGVGEAAIQGVTEGYTRGAKSSARHEATL
ncbi:Uncharacterised protein [Mycobacteroides abscessus subsp. abscessus]|nr:Uncharacterised protein [Mycobacteroides abscessus subsp. abscessus]SKT33692.1 Uncharacterised protein [Mycobacteroides abscessus subsp. abscessus]SKU28582.1 Uncharacterised protein [Mycobacteroides abscessus subsp. abscessus]